MVRSKFRFDFAKLRWKSQAKKPRSLLNNESDHVVLFPFVFEPAFIPFLWHKPTCPQQLSFQRKTIWFLYAERAAQWCGHGDIAPGLHPGQANIPQSLNTYQCAWKSYTSACPSSMRDEASKDILPHPGLEHGGARQTGYTGMVRWSWIQSEK